MNAIDPHFLPWQAKLLEQALAFKQRQRLPHAVLIDTSSELDIGGFALYLSMLLLCDESENLSLCGKCQACRMMSAGTYADFNFITLEVNVKSKKLNKNIKIDQIRNLIHEVSLTPQYERLKVAVIYPAETMNKPSANALLKTLEEPAPQVLLILLTHNPGKIPITLRSRCQSWSIDTPSREAALKWLREQGVEDETAVSYLYFAGGDPVLALNLEQQGYAEMVTQFKSRFARFLRGDLSASELCRGLLTSENAIVRRLINMILKAYCYHGSGVDADADTKPGANRLVAQGLLDLRLRAQYQLLVEENNLDFQLQLEDVLISLKQILTRRLI